MKDVTPTAKSEEEAKEQSEESSQVQKVKPKNETRNVLLFIGVVLVTLFALVVLPYLFVEPEKTLDELHAENYLNPPTESSYTYNGFSFVKAGDSQTNREFWYTQYALGTFIYDLPMRYGPRELESIPKVIENSVPRNNYTQMYITIDPSNSTQRQFLTLAISEYSKKLFEVKSYPITAACTKNETFACSERPIVTCDNTEDAIVSYFKEDPETKITIDGNCFIIQGEGEDLDRAATRVVYELLGIME